MKLTVRQRGGSKIKRRIVNFAHCRWPSTVHQRGGVKIERRIVNLRTVISLGGAVDSASKGGGKME